MPRQTIAVLELRGYIDEEQCRQRAGLPGCEQSEESMPCLHLRGA